VVDAATPQLLEPQSELGQLLPAIDRQARRLAALADGVLDAAQLQAGRIPQAAAEVDLVEVVRESAAPFAELQRSQGGTFELALPQTLCAFTDRNQLAQLVSHLCSNAVKYGEARPVQVQLGREDGQAVLRVCDHGLGIAPGDQQRIFDRFERAAPGRAYWGIGLGLWISRQIAQSLGGLLHLQSELGKGSIFTFELPLRKTC
jgi:signal transduction histidine kinase